MLLRSSYVLVKRRLFSFFTSGMKTVNKPFIEPVTALPYSRFSVGLSFCFLYEDTRGCKDDTGVASVPYQAHHLLTLPAVTGLESVILP